MTLPQSPMQRAAEPLIHSISGGADRCASPAAALRLIGQSTGHLPAKRRPSDAERRAAAAVVAALGELIREQWNSGEDPWQAEVPESAAELARRTGASENEVAAALRLLTDSHVVASVFAAGQRRLRLSQEVFEEYPALAQVDGGSVRRQLDMSGASVAPALAVLRELAIASGGHRDTARPGPWIEVSLAGLSEATLFKRTAVSRALADLDKAGLVERATRSGRQHSYRLLPSVFGGQVEPVPGPAAGVPASDPIPSPRSTAPNPVAIPAPGPGVVIEIGGARLWIGPGIECGVELDPNGAPVLRVGRAGPT